MDAFFAAAEQRDNPQYREKPVIVGADPKAGKGRGVVSTCSYEARKFGIHSAMPISIAYRKCPEAIFLPVDMEKYSRLSGQIFNSLKYFSPVIEQVSIDEAFLDISETFQIFGTPFDTCRAIKERIKKETGLTASVGLAPTKMAAKIASGFKKPDGLVEVKKEKLIDFLWPLDVDKLWGVGVKTKAMLNRMNIFTIGDLAKISKDELAGVFGKNGIWFWEMAAGIDESEVASGHEGKSISRQGNGLAFHIAKAISKETTFEKDTREKRRIEKELSWLCEQVAGRLRQENFKCRTITLKIRLEGFQTYTRATTLETPTNFPEVFIKEIRQLYRENFEIKDKKVRLVGVRASGFSCADERNLFEDKNERRKQDVHKAVDKIRQKFGDSIICRASSKDAEQ